MQTITKLEDLKKEFQYLNQSTYNNILHNVKYMDIETTGLSPARNHITLIGLHSPESTNIYIDKYNHKRACEDIEACKYLVTFNGNKFDIPFIDKHYGLKQEFKSIDLMYLFWQLGYKGGLKKIERALGLSRMKEVAGMDGSEAITLWHRYKQGDQDSLKRLINYNIEDIVNLEVLFDFVLQRSYGAQPSPSELRQTKANIMNRIKEKNALNVWN